jgi:hypothetical protein
MDGGVWSSRMEDFDLIIMEVSSGTWHMDQRINGPKIQHAFSLQLDVMRY